MKIFNNLLLFFQLIIFPIILLEIQVTFGIECERILFPPCQGLGYNLTAMPNLAGHKTQKEAETMINEHLELLESKCSKRARFLLCASLFPFCSSEVPHPVHACKEVCEKVKQDCTTNSVLADLWPKIIDCDQLPEPNNGDLCMQVPDEEKETKKIDKDPNLLPSAAVSILNKHPDDHMWSWQNNGFPSSGGGGLGGLSSSLSPSSHLHDHIICPLNFTISFDQCIPICGRDAMFTYEQKKITQTWTLVLSGLCFILTLFSIVTFWAEPMRFGYPERPVLYLALCYNLLSVCYLERLIFHNNLNDNKLTTLSSSSAIYDAMLVGGDNRYYSQHNHHQYHQQQQQQQQQLSNCGTTPPCLASYITTSYLTLSAATWWFIFAICWYLSTEKQWSSEALEKKSGLFHVLAWVLPLAPPIGALLWGAVLPHELTGMCSSYGFVEIPTIILLIAGAFLIILTTKSLSGLSVTVNDNSFYQRLTQIRTRILLFSFVFFIPALLAVLLVFFEHNTYFVIPCSSVADAASAAAATITTTTITNNNCLGPDKQSAVLTLIRLFFILAGGSLAGMWVWSRKTCESYRSRISTTSVSSPNTLATSMTVHHHHQQHQQQQQQQHHHLQQHQQQHYHRHHYNQYPNNNFLNFNNQYNKTCKISSSPTTKKGSKSIGPLYSSINFHPIYRSNDMQ